MHDQEQMRGRHGSSDRAGFIRSNYGVNIEAKHTPGTDTYCAACEAEATTSTTGGAPLCTSCGEVYGWGQTSLREQNAALLAALEAIKARGEAWLASDHDYSTSYADRPDGDRAANTMLAIARDALAKAGA